MKKYNFTVRLHDEKSNWNGLVETVHSGITEFGICEIAKNKGRLKLVDFTDFIFLDQVVFASQSHLLRKHQLELYSYKITPEVRALLALTYLLFICLICSFNAVFDGSSMQQQQQFKNKTKRRENVPLQLLGIFLKQRKRLLLLFTQTTLFCFCSQ